MKEQQEIKFGWVVAFWACALLWVIAVITDFTSGFATTGEIVYHCCMLLGWLIVSVIQTAGFYKQFKAEQNREG